MKRQSTLNNYVFQMLYQFLILVIPLILSPYLTRTLGKTSLGIYAYSNSIAYYFVILATLGISRHGQRIISANSDNTEVLRKKFWSLLAVHAAFSVLAILLYWLFISAFVKENAIIYRIQTFYVASALFDITWFFQGLENFKSVIVKNAAVKLIECICIFIFVKGPEDLWIYTMIAAAGLFIGQAVMIPQAAAAAKPAAFSIEDVKEHIKPMCVLGVTVIAAALYTVFDKTLLGLMTSKENVAVYEYSNKIINIPKTIIGVTGTVLYPRACRMAAQNDISGQQSLFRISMLVTSFIGFASVFGLMASADLLSVVYYGKAFADCAPVIKALAPLILIIGLGDILRTQYIIPRKMDGEFVKCLCINAVLNLIISTAMIPKMGVYGAVFGTLTAECFGLACQVYLCRDVVTVRELFISMAPFAVMGAVICAAVCGLNSFLPGNALTLLIDVAAGGMLFTLMFFLYIRAFRKDIFRLFQNRRKPICH